MARDAHRWLKTNYGPQHAQLFATHEAASGKAGPALASWQWAAIVARWQGCCAYCGGEVTALAFFRPLSHGGARRADNVVPSCRQCEASKAERPPADWCAARGVNVLALVRRMRQAR